jgi:hypothetical protein
MLGVSLQPNIEVFYFSFFLVFSIRFIRKWARALGASPFRVFELVKVDHRIDNSNPDTDHGIR